MNEPRFSILIPTFNRCGFIKECVDSIFSQNFGDCEIIVIDDGSTDKTTEVLKSYGSRIKTCHQANQGPEVARNLGASQAQGEYLVFLDSDDFLLPWALSTYNRIIMECDSPALIIGKIHWYMDGQNLQKDISSGEVIQVLRYRDFFSKDISVGLSCSNIAIKSSIFRQAGGHRQSTPQTFHADEHDTILRFGTYGPCAVLERPETVAHRVHEGNTVRDLEGMVNGVLSLVKSERQGQYPGGRKCLIERYSIIGGMALCWIKHAMKAGLPLLGVRLFFLATPMIIVGALNRILRFFRRRTPPIIIH